MGFGYRKAARRAGCAQENGYNVFVGGKEKVIGIALRSRRGKLRKGTELYLIILEMLYIQTQRDMNI